MTLLATLDRIAIGSILRSKLVFLINVLLPVTLAFRGRWGRTTFCRVCGHWWWEQSSAL